MPSATAILCSRVDGSFIACSPCKEDRNGDWLFPDWYSPEMLSQFASVIIEEPFKDVELLVRKVLDENGEIVHKFRTFFNFDTVYPTERERADIRDRNKQIRIEESRVITRDVMQERQRTGNPIPSVIRQG